MTGSTLEAVDGGQDVLEVGVAQVGHDLRQQGMQTRS